MQPASSSPKTREGASRPEPTSQSVRSPSGSKTGESRRRNLSVNPRAIICTPLDETSDHLETATHNFQDILPFIYLLHRKSWRKNILAVGVFLLFHLLHPHRPCYHTLFSNWRQCSKNCETIENSLHICFMTVHI